MRNLNRISPAGSPGPRRSTGVRAAAEHHAYSQGLTPGGPGWGDAIRDFVLNAPAVTGGGRRPDMPGRTFEMQQRRFEPDPVERGRLEPSFEDEWQALLAVEGGTKTSRAGAVGPAQIMPEFGTEYAQRAGLPWDEERARTDDGYNLALGRAYYAALRQIYDAPTAAAAYNNGPYGFSTVLGHAVRAGYPDDWEQYLPKETRDHVRKFRGLLNLADSPREPVRRKKVPSGTPIRVLLPVPGEE